MNEWTKLGIKHDRAFAGDVQDREGNVSFVPTTVTVASAAAYIGESPARVYRLLQKGEISFRRKGRRVFPFQHSLDVWLETKQLLQAHEPVAAPAKPRREPRCFTDWIDQMIRDRGFSVRKAKKIRKAIFDALIRALDRGEVVEMPVGEMNLVRSPEKRQRTNRLNNKQQVVAVNTRPRRIVFRPNPCLTEVVPTHFYSDAQDEVLKRLSRKPWALDAATHRENLAILEQERIPTRQELRTRWLQKQLQSVPPAPPIGSWRKPRK